MRIRSRLGLWLLSGACACVVEAPGGEKSGERSRAVVSQVPPLSIQSGANLDGKVELVGGTVQPGKLTQNDPAKVTVFWKVLEELDRDYVIFVHVEDGGGRMARFNVDHPPAGGAYPTGHWKKGETVKDEFSITLPGNYSSNRVNLWIGLWEPKSDTRLKLRNPEAVKNDGNNRVLFAQVPAGS